MLAEQDSLLKCSLPKTDSRGGGLVKVGDELSGICQILLPQLDNQ